MWWRINTETVINQRWQWYYYYYWLIGDWWRIGDEALFEEISIRNGNGYDDIEEKMMKKSIIETDR